MPKQGESHPEIGSIIYKRDEIHGLIYTARNYISAMEKMVGLIYELKPEDQDKTLLDELLHELRVLEGNQSSSNRIRMQKNKENYWRYLQKLNTILWEKNYLSNEKYSMKYPAGNKKSGEALRTMQNG